VDASGNLFIAGTSDPRIRKVSAGGIITTAAGTGTQGFGGDGGPATAAWLYEPWGVATDTAGNLFIADAGNQRIRKVSPDGIITTIAGTGVRSYEVHPKKLLVREGDAQERLADAIREAEELITSGKADFLAVTCHAVLHELFDRGKEAFDPLAFFGTIFSTNHSTWFTYREPGVPEKWPDHVLLKARCSAKSLLALAEAIRSRHPVINSLTPKPSVVGDHVRLHKTLAMEVLAKLFYLQDLEHEIHRCPAKSQIITK
jgi:hypothetical protein